MGGGSLAEKLKQMNIPRPFSGEWCAERVIDIIKNEKYTGNALLQKKYVVDHLSKKLVHNNGQLPKYYAECTHPVIIDQGTFDMAQAVLNSHRVKNKTKSNTCSRYPFSSLLECGLCGKKYKRKDRKGKVAWYCSTFLQKGKAACPSKQVPESVLYSLGTKVLGLEEFSADVLRKEIAEILVPEPGKLIFGFRDGHTVEKLWQHKSRSESWTEEMRDTARILVKRRH